jgi:hypothetical protein
MAYHYWGIITRHLEGIESSTNKWKAGAETDEWKGQFPRFSLVLLRQFVFNCNQKPLAEVTKLLCPHHEGADSPHPIRVEGPDLWYQMALVDTTVEQGLVSSAEGTRRA